jgi:large conductance mechanosensitive channel
MLVVPQTLAEECDRMSWVKEFKDWIMKGNLIAIAVGLIIALAFADLVKSFTASLVTPIIAAIGGQPDFSALDFQINGSTFRYGAFINAVITFLIVALVMFVVVKAALRIFAEKPAEPAEYVVETYDPAAINARSADGWEVVSAGAAGVVMKK